MVKNNLWMFLPEIKKNGKDGMNGEMAKMILIENTFGDDQRRRMLRIVFGTFANHS